MRIVYENQYVMVVEKPHGWLTTPARFADDPRPVLGVKLQEAQGKQIFPVHRLDFEVGGLTLWAKDPESHRRAQLWFENSELRRVYRALSLPAANVTEGEWTSNLAKGKRRAFEAEHGKASRTLARILKKDKYWEWELTALTGRPHQLRFEMAKHGANIVGDRLYGGVELAKPNYIALRAVELDFSNVPDRLDLPRTLEAPARWEL